MKIGIFTLWQTKENYGAVLQCYALIKYLSNRGHDVKLVKNIDAGCKKQSVFHRIITLICMLFKGKSFPYKISSTNNTPTKIVDRGFSSFFDKYIPSYQKEFSSEDLESIQLDADVLICGSDQVWSTVSPVYYLQMKGSFKRVAYAASFGGFDIINIFDRKKVSLWMKSFDLITVREQEGIEKCKSLGCKATVVPDPTLLLEKSDYLSIADENYETGHKPYLLLYLLGNTMELEVKKIMDFAHNNGLEVKYVASHGREDKYDKIYPTIEQWLTLYRDAKYVITNSFHGTVFSLIFEVPFITIPLAGCYSRMNGRIEGLLGVINLSERIFSGDLSYLFKPIDFEYITRIRIDGRKTVLSLLNSIGI